MPHTRGTCNTSSSPLNLQGEVLPPFKISSYFRTVFPKPSITSGHTRCLWLPVNRESDSHLCKTFCICSRKKSLIQVATITNSEMVLWLWGAEHIVEAAEGGSPWTAGSAQRLCSAAGAAGEVQMLMQEGLHQGSLEHQDTQLWFC